MSEVLIEMENLGVAYRTRQLSFRSGDPVWAIRDVSLSLRRSETLGVIGHNAAGKSTLLRAIAGIVAPDRGHIERATSSISLLSLQVGFIPHLNGYENALLSSMLLGLTRKQSQANLAAIEEFSELGEFMSMPLASYSSGMKARLGFAVAQLAKPEVLLIDEVLGVGDHSFIKKSSSALREVIQSDRTVVLVSHNMHTIQTLADRVVWLDEGKSIAEGLPADLIPDYLENLEHRTQVRSKTD